MTMCTCSHQLQPHEPRKGVCPDKFYGMPLTEWNAYGAKPINWDLLCDDCGRGDGTHDDEIEH